MAFSASLPPMAHYEAAHGSAVMANAA